MIHKDNAFEVLADEGTDIAHDPLLTGSLAGSSVAGSMLKQFTKHSVKMPDMR